jgi:hypothetical protein
MHSNEVAHAGFGNEGQVHLLDHATKTHTPLQRETITIVDLD